MAEAKWYVVHTYSAYENTVKATIEKSVETRHLEDLIHAVTIPMETVTEITDQGPKTVDRKIFPGYVLVHMIHDDEVAYLIRSIRGVTGFLGAEPTKPIPLTASEIAAMGVDLGETVEINLSVGDPVRIVGNAMDGFTGTVQSIDTEAGTCMVLVSMFGQQTPTEFPLTEVVREN